MKKLTEIRMYNSLVLLRRQVRELCWQAMLDKSINTFSDAINTPTLKMRVPISLGECYFQAASEGVFKGRLRSSTDASHRCADDSTAVIKRHTFSALNTLGKQVVLQRLQQSCYLRQDPLLLVKRHSFAERLGK
jgi:hypothetical protein